MSADTIDERTTAVTSQAACRDLGGSLTAMFFSEDLTDVIRATRVCARCPVQLLCLETAIERAEPWGVWGGHVFRNGRILTTKRRAGRPPKVARPEDQLPDIPVPVHLRGHLRSA